MTHPALRRAALGGLALLSALTLAACGCDPEDAARTFAGTDALDCGGEAPEARAACALDAQDAGVPFFLVEQRQGPDSARPFGFARNREGESASFAYEPLATTPGTQGSARVSMRSCERLGTDAAGVLTCVSPGAPVAVCR